MMFTSKDARSHRKVDLTNRISELVQQILDAGANKITLRINARSNSISISDDRPGLSKSQVAELEAVMKGLKKPRQSKKK